MGAKLTLLQDQSLYKPKGSLSVDNVDLKKLKKLILVCGGQIHI